MEAWEIPCSRPIDCAGECHQHEAQSAPANVSLDQPQNVARARALLRQYVGPRRGCGRAGGDNRTYQVACEILSLGLSIDAHLNCFVMNGTRIAGRTGATTSFIRKSKTPPLCAERARRIRNPSAQQMFAAVAQFASSVSDPKRSKFCPLFPRDMRSLPDSIVARRELFPPCRSCPLRTNRTFKTFTALDIGVG